MTSDPDVLQKTLSSLTVSGGGDCPELAMAGLKLALENTQPESLICLFTDASAKDYSLLSDVLALVQAKRSTVCSLKYYRT